MRDNLIIGGVLLGSMLLMFFGDWSNDLPKQEPSDVVFTPRIVGLVKPGQKVYLFPESAQIFKSGEDLIVKFKK